MSTPSRFSPANAGAGQSPAETAGVAAAVKTATRDGKTRRPMSAPTRRLEATSIPGYHLHWIKAENILQAQQAFYDFVLVSEVEINHRNVTLDTAVGATSDLSDRVTVQYGSDTLYLMKLDESLYNEDMAALAAKNAELWKQIFRGEQIAGTTVPNPGDTSHTYIKEDMTKAEGGALNRAKQALYSRKYK